MDNKSKQTEQAANLNQSSRKRSKNAQLRHVSLHDKVFKKVHRYLKLANKKEFGKSITISDVVNLGMDSISEDGIEGLKKLSLRSKDKLEISYREYCQRNGKVPKAEFISKIMDIWANHKQDSGGPDLNSNGSFVDQDGEE